MLCYPVILEKDPETGTVMVSFPDTPFAHAVGDDEAEALLNAEDALVTAFEIFEEQREAIPMPSEIVQGQPVAILSVLVAAKARWYSVRNQAKFHDF